MANARRNEIGGAALSGNPALASKWLDPAQRAAAAKQVIDAVRATATMHEAAEMLQIGKRTLHRWIWRFSELEELRVDGRTSAADDRLRSARSA